ncbi:hypothetical protein CEXT_751951 [Caerostris extrusa]|uniref:Uncharacterized protein n=1 Tax=Caerostris extrusa TaxID=172846 RepID=A0AAV4TN17_CAEEX|nr:hypothetical protein CEXT_751951 [Caerostris extrusa]
MTAAAMLVVAPSKCRLFIEADTAFCPLAKSKAKYTFVGNHSYRHDGDAKEVEDDRAAMLYRADRLIYVALQARFCKDMATQVNDFHCHMSN